MEYTRNIMFRRLQGIERSIRNLPSLEQCNEHIRELEIIKQHADNLEGSLDLVENASNIISQLHDIINSAGDEEEEEEGEGGGGVGEDKKNKRLKIDPERLTFFIEKGYTVRDIARLGLLGKVVHHNTVHNAIKKHNITAGRQRYNSTLSNDQLKEIIRGINRNFPNTGVLGMLSHLRSKIPPVILQRDRCRELLRAVDPRGTAMRWAQAIQRRQYNVPTPNSLWHIDTNHALIRWNFVVHGCIDGYSRLIPFLRLSTNNLARTAFNFFLESVREYGVPSRVRADGGSEFVHVQSFMNAVNGVGRGSMLRGPSVHNQRIERLWRDVYTKVLDKYYKLFNHMEENRILNISDEIDLFCLHKTFAPRIDLELSTWRNAHNNHGIRTEHYKTPNQLWVAASIQNQNVNNTAMDNLFRRDLSRVEDTVQIYLREENLLEPDDISIVLPRVEPPLTNAQCAELSQLVNVTRSSASHGIDIYGTVKRFVMDCTTVSFS